MVFSLLSGLAVLLGDRLSKRAARAGRLPSTLLDGHVLLRPTENRGTAGSRHQGSVLLTKVLPSAALGAAAAVLLPDFARENALCQTGTALLLSGGGSNLYDRLTRGSVTDMAVFPHAPGKLRHLVWNIADFALAVGTVCAVIGIWTAKK